MKTFRKITSILFVAATMLMAACDPYDDQFPIPSDEYINDVNQTSWVYEEHLRVRQVASSHQDM